MKKSLIAAALIVGFASPLLAADNFYIMFDKTAKKCSVSKTAITDTEKYDGSIWLRGGGHDRDARHERVQRLNT